MIRSQADWFQSYPFEILTLDFQTADSSKTPNPKWNVKTAVTESQKAEKSNQITNYDESDSSEEIPLYFLLYFGENQQAWQKVKGNLRMKLQWDLQMNVTHYNLVHLLEYDTVHNWYDINPAWLIEENLDWWRTICILKHNIV